jgi:hypothetical protein
MARTIFGPARIHLAPAVAAGLALLAACSDGGTVAVRRQQAAASALPGYACTPSPVTPNELNCTRRGAAPAASTAGPPAGAGRLSRSAALAVFPRNAPRARGRTLPLTGRFGVILPGLALGRRPAASSEPMTPAGRRWHPPSAAAPGESPAPSPPATHSEPAKIG